MADLAPLFTPNPITIPAATYNLAWVREVVVSAPDIGGDATASVTLVLYRNTPGGCEQSPTEPQRLVVENLLHQSASDPELKTAIAALMSAIAKAAGLSSTPVRTQS